MLPHHLTDILRDYVGFGPGIVVSFVVSVASAGYVGRRLGTSWLHGWAVVMSLGLILSATVTPSREAILLGAQGSGACDLGRLGLASLWELRHIDESSLNVLLFVPLGISVGLCPRSRAKHVVLLGALMLPVAIELTQLVAVGLGRECQSSDVVDNLTGLTIGVVVGSVARVLATRVIRDSRGAREGDGPPG